MVLAGTACAEEAAQETVTGPDGSNLEEQTTVSAEEEAQIDMEVVQRFLSSLGFEGEDAITEFQTIYGIDITGEADTQTLDMLRMLVDSIATEKEDSEYDLTLFRNVNILKYADGKYYVEPNTVSDKMFESVEDAMKAVIESVKASTEIPAKDTKVLVAINKDALPVHVLEKDVIEDGDDAFLDVALLRKLSAKDGSLEVTDTEGNKITFATDAEPVSDTGNIVVKIVDYDDASVVVNEKESKTLEDAFATEMTVINDGSFTIDEVAEDVADNAIESADDVAEPAEEEVRVVETIMFRNIEINRMSDDTYQVAQNSVSEKTLDEFRKAYTAVRYAYLHSTAVPTSDVDTRIQVDIENLPEGVEMADLTQGDDGNYYISVHDLQMIADRTGEDVVIQDTDGNTVTVTDLGTVDSDTGNVVSQNVDVQTGEATTEFETKPVEEATQQETRPADPVAEIPTEVEVPTTVAPEPETERPTQPSGGNTDHPTQPEEPTTSGQVEQPTQHTHNWVDVTKTVHHDAVTHTVNHPAETHEETVYKTVHHDAVTSIVHHDATYETVHHDAVTEEQWVTDTSTVIVQCTGCGAEFPAATQYDAVEYGWFPHSEATGCQGWTAYRPGYYETVVITPAWDETICTGAAWDEEVVVTPAWDEQVANGTTTVVDKAAWVETVVDKAAWDEVVVTGQKCSVCGATK